MRPTKLSFKPPTEFTPGPYQVKGTCDGDLFIQEIAKKAKRNSSGFSRDSRFKPIKKSPGPTSYNTIEAFDSAYKKKKPAAVMSKSMIGDHTANGAYRVVGSTVQFDRSWLSRAKTRNF